MDKEHTFVTCAHCGTSSPYRVIDSYGWLVLHYPKCFKQFSATIQDGIVIGTK